MSGIAEMSSSEPDDEAEAKRGGDEQRFDVVRSAGLSRRLVWNSLIILVAVAAAGLLWQFKGITRAGDPLLEISSQRSMIVARRVGVAFDDIDQTWASWFRSRGLEPPHATEPVLFSNARPSSCSGTSPVGGPFYCPLDEKASFDLVFLDQLEKRMDREAGLGTALLVARVIAEHVQVALGVPAAVAAPDRSAFSRDHALQADCLAGVWAGMASARIGTVPPDFYAKLLMRGNLLMETHGKGGKSDRPALDIFYFDDFMARELAFREGRETRRPSACPRPG